MATRRFEFELQPVLDLAEAEVAACEESLSWAREALLEAREKEDKAAGEFCASVQRERQTRDNLMEASVSATARLWSASVRAARAAVDSAARRREERRTETQWCEDRVNLRETELNEAIAKAGLFRRLRQRDLDEHAKRVERMDEREIEDSSIQSWNSRRP